MTTMTTDAERSIYRSRSSDDTRNTIENEGLRARRHHPHHPHPSLSSSARSNNGLGISPVSPSSPSPVLLGHGSHQSPIIQSPKRHHRRSYTVDSPPPNIPTNNFYLSDAAATSPGKLKNPIASKTSKTSTTTSATTTNMMMYNTPTNSFDTAPTTPPSSPPHHYQQGNNRSLRLQQQQQQQQYQHSNSQSSLKAAPHPIVTPTRSPTGRSFTATSAASERPATASPRTPPPSSPPHRRSKSGIVGRRSPFSLSRSRSRTPPRSRSNSGLAADNIPPIPAISIGDGGEDDSNFDFDDDIEGDYEDGGSTSYDGGESCMDNNNNKIEKNEDKKLNIVRSMEGLLWNANYVLGHALRPGIQGIQTDLFRTCSGICILSCATVGLLISGSVGTGVFMRHIKQHDTWSSPVACGIASLSVGALVGGALKDLFIFFMDDDSVEAFYKKGVRMGMKLNLTLGVGRVGESHFGASKDGKKAETLTFGFAQGIFVGASLDGGVVGPRRRINEKFYGKGKKSPAHIVAGKITFPFHNQLAVKIMKELTDKLNEAGKRSLKTGRRKTAETTVLSALSSSLSPFKTSNHKKSCDFDQDDIFYIVNETGVSNGKGLSSTIPMNRVNSDPSNPSNSDFKVKGVSMDGSRCNERLSHPAPSLPSLSPRDDPFYQQELSHQRRTISLQPFHARTGSCDAFGSVSGEMHGHRHCHSYSASDQHSQPVPTLEPAFYPGINDLDQFCSKVAKSGHIRRQSIS
mmetsp:Transcript_3957/g.9662  ORF Transcript_3957/g.9662 Transcript_3957/m.9662 type:complete len:744 (+) Transcript_3957:211-2442(+)